MTTAEFTAKVQGTFDYKAEMASHMTHYLQEKAQKAELDKHIAKAASEAAWAKYIKEHAR